ncbi:DUF6881 domain-containing protein [Amycolatopsis kentuckyensis]|uniref:DUF6881 domain-containing protein n=1 Tax=Amycolatopsis kentuckyensis TaxID=218823 RepID=UPI003365A1D9
MAPRLLDDPVLLYSEQDAARYETRKVEVYRDGRGHRAGDGFDAARLGAGCQSGGDRRPGVHAGGDRRRDRAAGQDGLAATSASGSRDGSGIRRARTGYQGNRVFRRGARRGTVHRLPP